MRAVGSGRHDAVLVDDLDGVGARDAQDRARQPLVGRQGGRGSGDLLAGDQRRAPSWTPTRSQVPASARAAKPFRTERARSAPPATTFTTFAMRSCTNLRHGSSRHPDSLTTTTHRVHRRAVAQRVEGALQHGDAEQRDVLLGMPSPAGCRDPPPATTSASVGPRRLAPLGHWRRSAHVRQPGEDHLAGRVLQHGGDLHLHFLARYARGRPR